MTPAALHSSEHAEHYTPSLIVEPVRRVLGGIDLDPASCAAANETVQATHYLSESGLAVPWGPMGALSLGLVGAPTRVFLNPPGGKLSTKTLEPIESGPGYSSAAVWWAKLHDEWRAGRVECAIFVCFSLNVFQNTQADELATPPPQAFPFCVPRKRVQYAGPGARSGPPHPSAIVYLPPHGRDVSDFVDRFREQFSPLGFVRT